MVVSRVSCSSLSSSSRRLKQPGGDVWFSRRHTFLALLCTYICTVYLHRPIHVISRTRRSPIVVATQNGRTRRAPIARRASRLSRDMARIEPLLAMALRAARVATTHSKACVEVPGRSSDRMPIFFSPNAVVHGRIATDRRTGCLSRHRRLGPLAQPARHALFSQLPRVSTMNPKSQPPKRPDVALSSLNVAIDAMNVVKDVMEGTPAKAAFASVSVILTMIRVGLLLIRLDQPRVKVFRIQWSTKQTLLSLDWPVLMYFKPFIGGSREDGKTSSAGPSARRLNG